MPTVLITGSNRGLGFEFVRQYAADHWHVIATCRNPDKAEALQKLSQQYPALQIEPMDVADEASIAALAEKLKDVALDVLINNAGILTGIPNASLTSGENDPSQNFGTLDAKAWHKVFWVNSIAPIMVSQAFLSNVRKGTERKIAMISSGWGSIAMTAPGYIAYRTSKAALNMAMRTVALTLAPEKIIVASLRPGLVKTDMGGPRATYTAEESVKGMRRLITTMTMQQSGQYLDPYDRASPW